MRFTLTNPERTKSVEAQLPATGKEIQDFCDQLGLRNTAKTLVTIDAVEEIHKQMKEDIFQGKTFILDELNFLSKQTSKMDGLEAELFSHAVSGKNLSMTEIINTAENAYLMSIQENQVDMVEVAKKIASGELTAFKKENANFTPEEASKYLCDLCKGEISEIMPDGKLLYHGNDWDEIYNGSCFSQLPDENIFMSVEMEFPSGVFEYLRLPFHESELAKSLERLGVSEESQYPSVKVALFDCQLHGIEKEIVEYQELTVDTLPALNEVAEFHQDFNGLMSPFLRHWITVTDVSTIEELATLGKNFEQLKCYEGVDSASTLGEHLLKNSSESDSPLKEEGESLGLEVLNQTHHVENKLWTYEGDQKDMIELMDKIEGPTMEIAGMT